MNTGKTSSAELIENNMPLVGHVVSQMHGRYPMIEREEMVSAGLEGLVHAANSFSDQAGAAFSTWAHLKIKWSIQQMMQEMDWMGRRGRDRAKRIQSARAELAQIIGAEPTDQQLASAMGVPVEQITRTTSESARVAVPLDDELAEIVAASTQSPEQQIVEAEQDLLLHRAVTSLPERTQQVMVLHYLQGTSQAEIAQRLGVSEALVSKEKMRGLALLREALADPLQLQSPAPTITAVPVPAKARVAYLASASSAMQGGIVPALRPAV